MDQPARLPCGRSVQNRLVKVAMYEHLAAFPGGPPNEHHCHLYAEWAKHAWGIVITGNVQVAPDHLTLGRDVVLPLASTKESLLPFQKLAASIHGHSGTLAIMQLNHPGRQSSNFIGGRWPLQPPLAPSPLRLGSGKSGYMEKFVNNVMFQTPKEMSEADIQETMDRFVYGAIFAHEAGFDGVQLHVAHGYLLAQFLSPQANKRHDAYSYDKALDIIRTIVQRIRTSTPKDFVVGIKLNAADYTPSSNVDASPLTEHEQRALQHLLEIASWRTVDIVEISGGDYEKPDFMASASSNPTSKSPRQAFFARFSQQAVSALSSWSSRAGHHPPLILLTGGLRSPALLHSAIAHKHADLLGLGRAAVLSPDIPSILFNSSSTEDDRAFNPPPDLRTPALLTSPWSPLSWVWALVPSVKLIGAGVGMAWYVVAMRRLALPLGAGTYPSPDYSIGGLGGVYRMWAWMPSAVDGRSDGYYQLLEIIAGMPLSATEIVKAWALASRSVLPSMPKPHF